MKVNLRVTDLDGNDRTVVAEFRDLCLYERHTGKSVMSWKDQTPGVYDFAVLAWTVETGQRVPFETWTDSVQMALFEGFDTANPTKPGESPGSP